MGKSLAGRSIRCSKCGSFFLVNLTDLSYFELMDESFCSVDCIVDHLFSFKGLSDEDIEDLRKREMLCEVPDSHKLNNFSFHSTFLGVKFRSAFELLVAEALVSRGLEVFYEPFLLTIPDRKGKCFHYIPDFFVKPTGVFIEVKGLWLHGSKRRFKITKSIFEENILLFPPIYRGWFVEAANARKIKKSAHK